MNFLTAILLCSALLSSPLDKERRLRLEYDDLTAQAAALVEAANQTEADLRSQGLVMHPDIASARNRLVTAMDRSADAVAQHDWKELSKCLERERGWIDRLRRKL